MFYNSSQLNKVTTESGPSTWLRDLPSAKICHPRIVPLNFGVPTRNDGKAQPQCTQLTLTSSLHHFINSSIHHLIVECPPFDFVHALFGNKTELR